MLGELVLALATSWLAQKGREGLSRLIRGGVTIAVLGGAWWFARRTSAAFTNEERAPLARASSEHGEPRLRHPALGFSILHPGPGFVLPASQAYRADAQFYVFTDEAGVEAVTLALFKRVGARARRWGPDRGDGRAGRRARRQDVRRPSGSFV